MTLARQLSVKQFAFLKIANLFLKQLQPLQNVDMRGWAPWWRVRESFAGAWQENVEIRPETILRHPTVYACVTLIAGDISKMRCRLMSVDRNDIWTEAESPAFSPFFRKPNSYQEPIEFFSTWIISKLVNGNTYVLKQRDQRGVVVGGYVLDPSKVIVQQATDGSIWYELRRDYLSRVAAESIVVPSREIIHDKCFPLFHPLVGVSPLEAAGLVATQALNVWHSSSEFFGNGAQPGGVLTVQGSPSQIITEDLKTRWDANFSGANAGKVAVIADGMKYEPLKPLNATDAQMVETLKLADEAICRVFHVPGYKVGVGPQPTFNNVGALNQQYYNECLQHPTESIEQLLDEGLELPKPYRVAFDTGDLLRMDEAALITSEKAAQGLKTPNESRNRLNLPGIAGGETVYRQEQEHSLETLAALDAAARRAALTGETETPPSDPEPEDPDPTDVDDAKSLDRFEVALWRKMAA